MSEKPTDTLQKPSDLPLVLAIVGPTASGKSALAMEVARRTGGEIISCDSMQIYRGMDIGTAKPTEEERAEVPHHLIDIVPPSVEFSCADYRVLARQAVADIVSRGKLPIFCGGTGLYLDSALEEERFAPDVDKSIREELKKLTPDELYRKLKEFDPETAAKTHKNNVRRVIRALEIYIGTGIPKSEWDRRTQTGKKSYRAIKIGLDFHDRAKLYERINARVDQMIAAGLVEEVKKLPVPICKTAAQAIGYKEFFEHGFDNVPLVAELIKKDTRNYAKRQLTWFRRDPEIKWFYIDEGDGGAENFKNIVNSVIDIVNAAKSVV